MSKTSRSPAPPPGTTASEITDLSELVQKSAVVVTVFWPPGQPRAKQVCIKGRRLRPCEDDEVRMLLESVLPPLLPPEQPGGEPREDLRAPDYQLRLRAANREARAYALYCCFPVIRDGVRKAAGSGDADPERKALVKAVQELELDSELLGAMYVAATSALIHDSKELKDLVDFT